MKEFNLNYAFVSMQQNLDVVLNLTNSQFNFK